MHRARQPHRAAVVASACEAAGASPRDIEDALRQGKLKPGALLALGGFSHAGDYAAAAILRFRPGRSPVVS
jgi:hypothetical protein